MVMLTHMVRPTHMVRLARQTFLSLVVSNECNSTHIIIAKIPISTESTAAGRMNLEQNHGTAAVWWAARPRWFRTKRRTSGLPAVTLEHLGLKATTTMMTQASLDVPE